jgi:hypothetical protein
MELSIIRRKNNMEIFLENRQRDMIAFKRAIEFCMEDQKTVDVLKKYLKEIENEYIFADFLKSNFIPLIRARDDFYCAFIMRELYGEYRVEVFVKNLKEKTKNEYENIYWEFCNVNEFENENVYFIFKVYDIEKNRDIYEEAELYDKIVIKPRKNKKTR